MKMANLVKTGELMRVVGYCSIEGKDFARTMMNETSCKLWAKYDVWDN